MSKESWLDEEQQASQRIGHVMAKYREQLQALVRELSDAEYEQFEQMGPLTLRLHRSIVALCGQMDVPNRWDQEGP